MDDLSLKNTKDTSKMREVARKRLWQFGTSLQKMVKSDGPIIFERGDNCYLYDSNGHSYLDALSGVWVVNAGHGRSSIIEAMYTQSNQLNYVLSEEGYANPREIELAEKLSMLTDNIMDRSYFTNGGSEAVEMALRFARIFHRVTGNPKKKKFIARNSSYHGGTLLTLSVSGFPIFSSVLGPNPQGILHGPQPYCYRCELGLEYPDCGCSCAQKIEDLILEEGAETIAAFIGEPISASCGVCVPPLEYWTKIREICNKYNVLLIADEIVTAFGRTGKLFGMQHFGVWPDLMTMAKGITSGYAPLGAVMVNKEITKRVADNVFWLPGFTYTGHPLCCAAALANIDYIQDNDLTDNSARMGELLLSRLQHALVDHPHVGDIRGKGLMICIEITKDKKLKEPFSFDENIPDRLVNHFRNNGIYLRVIEEFLHVGPPLCITENQIEFLSDKLVEGLSLLNK